MIAGADRDVREISSIGEWLRWRQELITASRIGALFGVHPHLSLDELIAEMRGERRGQGDNPSMRAGRILEPAVIAALNEERPELRVVKANTFHVIPELRLGCTPDAFGDDGLLVECKTVSSFQWDQWRARPPLHYLLQTLTEMHVTGCSRGLLAFLIRTPSFPLYLFDVLRHPVAEQRILNAVAEFWRKWDAGEHPQPQAADGLSELMSDDGSSIDLTTSNHDLAGLLDERELLKQSLSVEEKRVGEIDAILKAALGRARSGWLPNWCITFQTQHRKETIIPAKDIRVLRARRLNDPDAADE